MSQLALLYETPRAATVRAGAGGLDCWAVDRHTFRRCVVATAAAKRAAYTGFLRGVPIFATLTAAEVLTVADALQPLAVPAGAVVVAQGEEKPDRFYVVESGELKAEIAGVAREVCPRLRRGDFFGERALLHDAPRAATVTAVQPSRLLAMDRAAFLRLLGPLADVLKRSEALYRAFVEEGGAAEDAAAPAAAAPAEA